MSNTGYKGVSEANDQLKHGLGDKKCTYAHSKDLIELDDWWKPWLLESRDQLARSRQILPCQLTTTRSSIHLIEERDCSMSVRRDKGILGWIYVRESVINISRLMRTHIVPWKDI